MANAMAAHRPAYTIHAMNGGEVSPRFEARQDQNKYQASLALCRNYMPMIIGGIRRREGTIFVAKTKFSGFENNKVRLIRFLFSTNQAYICEFGDLYVRFYREDLTTGNGIQIESSPGVPFELVTPWDEDMLDQLYDFQSADIKDICSDGTIEVHRLQRTAIDTFTLTADTPVVPGVVEDEPTGTELGPASITLSATSGDGVTVTASSGVFLAGDIDRSINSGAGVAVITAVGGATTVTVDIVSAFASVGPIAAADWSLAGTGGAAINPSRVRKGLNIRITADLAIFRAADVGKFIAVYGGFIKITRRQSTTIVFGHVYTTMRDAPAPDPVKTLEWTMYRNAWTTEDGFPTCGCYFQNRRYLCRDQKIWGSVASDFINFALGSGDGDGINSELSDDEINPILAIKALDKLYPMTSSQIFSVTPSSEGGPLTPNDFNIKPTGSEGVKRHVPIRALSNILYLQDGGRSMRELSFNFVDNKYKSPDMFRLADHIVEFNAIKGIDYQGRPDSVIWAWREDGSVFPCGYERNEEVVNWASFATGDDSLTDGFVQSLCVIPRVATGHDWPWIAVDRTINGLTETHIEYLDRQVDQCREWREAMTDSAVFTTADDEFVISGLDHLEGETVWVIGDGMLFNAVQDEDGNVSSTAVVVAGEITVSPQVEGVALYEVGLDYRSEALTLPPIIPNEMGGPLMARGWEVAAAAFRRTAALKINEEKIPLRQPGDAMDKPIRLKRGKMGVNVKQCDSEGRVRIVQDVPFPQEILNIMGRVAIGDEPKFGIFSEDEPQFFIDCQNPQFVCIDSTERGQQVISIEDRFSNQYLPNPANTRTSWGYISEDEELFTLVGNASFMQYNSAESEINHFTGPMTLDHPALVPSPGSVVAAFNTCVGVSDEPIYFYRNDVFFPVSNDSFRLFIPPGNFGFTDSFAKRGNRLYLLMNNAVGGPPEHVLVYDTEDGSLQDDWDLIALLPVQPVQMFVCNMGITDDFLYVLQGTTGPPPIQVILKIDRSDGSLVSVFDITHIEAIAIHAVSDDLIYILSQGSGDAALYYWNGSLHYIGSCPANGSQSAFGRGGVGTQFINGSLYFGHMGFSGGTPNIFRINIGCPPETGPILTSMTTDTNTVVRGSAITVNWFDVLEPDITDRIELRVEPVGGVLGYKGAALATFTNTLALGSGSTPFTIPVGTTPGNYVLQYVAPSSHYVATTPGFAVTA